MSDAQDETAVETQAITDASVDDVVTEKRPVNNKKHGMLLWVVVFTFVGGIAGAGWYYQSMWLPQVQAGVMQTQAWLGNMLASKETVDPIAAPMPKAESTDIVIEEDKPSYVVAAIPTAKKEIKKEAPINVMETHQDIKDDKPIVVDTVVTEPVFVEPKLPVVGSSKIVSTPNKEVRVNVSMASARQAFWQRDLPKAISLYQQINQSTANANSWGELGNIYYLQAKWQQAAFAYTEAALMLLDKGDLPQAMFLRYIVSGLDQTQLKRIEERVRALQAPVHG